jgi:putative transposase
MPRRKLIRTNEFPYHITSRSNNKEWFYIPAQDVWKYSNDLLCQGQQRFGIKVEAFVLMSNHYHLCLYTPKSNIDNFMQFFNKRLGERISRQAGRINRIFGAPYKWNLITDQKYYLNVIRYIYQNPLREGLCTRVELYPYSDLKFQSKHTNKLEWLNLRIGDREVIKTRKRLRKFIV